MMVIVVTMKSLTILTSVTASKWLMNNLWIPDGHKTALQTGKIIVMSVAVTFTILRRLVSRAIGKGSNGLVIVNSLDDSSH